MTNPHRTSNPASAATVVAGIVAIALTAGIIALALINPLALIGLAPVLFAIAAIVRAVTGARSDHAAKPPSSGNAQPRK